MAKPDKVKTTIYLTPETWDRFVIWMHATYGREVKVTSITIEQALKEFLDRNESPTPA